MLLALLPLAKAKLIAATDIIIDAKSGVSGAGRTLKQNILFAEAGEGLSPYGIGTHRHVPEIEQELGLAAKERRDRQLHAASRADVARRTLHLLCAAGGQGDRVESAQGADGRLCRQSVRADRRGRRHPRDPTCARLELLPYRRVRRPLPGRAIVVSAIDNLVKGSAGQALQNFNLMYGFDETTGLEQLPLFP